ncbi:unnamed protein product [Euphydryas editha]|uniref:Uncharacterized protein n=2 Tax=Euphydryas editha TaxID=104508 RepID=A0AAU9TH98_EUPED|nr:unnamed protein product [Euphydryas editha]
MQDEHRKAIQNNFISLVEQTDLDVMVSSLYEKGVFSERMIEPYKDMNKDTRDRKRQLYMDIPRRGPLAFGHLLDALSENGYWDLVRDLDPRSSLHARRPRNPGPSTSAGSNEKFLSISDEKKKTKTGTDINKNPVPPPPRPPADPKDLPDPTTIPDFHVVKSTKFFEDNDCESEIQLYRTRGRRRGVLVVFSYVDFDNLETYRSGVDADCKNLKYLFNEIGFRVLSYQDLTKKETLETLRGLKEVVVGAESVFIVVSSHGYEGPRGYDNDLRCSDGGLLSTRDVIDHFNNKNMPALRGVPKVFIFQLCRGSNEDSLWSSTATDGARDARDAGCATGPPRAARGAPPPPHMLPPLEPSPRDRVYSDILIAHSTVPGSVAYRDAAAGSWYIQVLCEVFAARAHDCHVEHLFTLVDKRLHDAFRVQTSSVDRWGFNRRLYLHPGLAEP